MPCPYRASVLQAVHQPALGNDVLDKRRERRGLKGLAGGFVRNDAGVKVDADRVALGDCLACGGAFEDRQADIDGIAEENTGKRFRNNCLYSKCLKNTRCLLSGGSASEVLSSNYKISRFNLFGKIRIQ